MLNTKTQHDTIRAIPITSSGKTKNQLSILLLLLFALLTFEKSIASIAYPHPVNVTQRDGSVITVTMQGDEYLKWAKTPDGYTLVYNKQGIYE